MEQTPLPPFPPPPPMPTVQETSAGRATIARSYFYYLSACWFQHMYVCLMHEQIAFLQDCSAKIALKDWPSVMHSMKVHEHYNTMLADTCQKCLDQFQQPQDKMEEAERFIQQTMVETFQQCDYTFNLPNPSEMTFMLGRIFHHKRFQKRDMNRIFGFNNEHAHYLASTVSSTLRKPKIGVLGGMARVHEICTNRPTPPDTPRPEISVHTKGFMSVSVGIVSYTMGALAQDLGFSCLSLLQDFSAKHQLMSSTPREIGSDEHLQYVRQRIHSMACYLEAWQSNVPTKFTSNVCMYVNSLLPPDILSLVCCAACGETKPKNGFSACLGCRLHLYCNETCRSSHREEHTKIVRACELGVYIWIDREESAAVGLEIPYPLEMYADARKLKVMTASSPGVFSKQHESKTAYESRLFLI